MSGLTSPQAVAQLLAWCIPADRRAHIARDVKLGDFAVLLFLDGPDASATIAELVEALGLAQASVSTSVARLRAAGLVEQQRDTFDHRRHPIRLSPKGLRLLRSARRYR